MKQKLREKLRRKAWEESNGRCVYCGKTANSIVENDPENHQSIDHIIPRSQAGANRLWNILAACFRCNQRRDRTYPVAGMCHSKFRTLVARKEAFIYFNRQKGPVKARMWLEMKYSQIPAK